MSVRLSAMRAEGDRGPEQPRPRLSGPLRKFADLFLKCNCLPRLNGVCFCGSDVIRAVGDKPRSGPPPKTPLSSSQDPSLDSERGGQVGGARGVAWCNGATCCGCLEALLPGSAGPWGGGGSSGGGGREAFEAEASFQNPGTSGQDLAQPSRFIKAAVQAGGCDQSKSGEQKFCSDPGGP